MRFSIFPRLRRTCRGNGPGPDNAALVGISPGRGPSAGIDALKQQPPTVGAAGALQGHDSRPRLNCVYLSGTLADDPQCEKNRNGDPVILLKVAYAAPDARATRGLEAALDEIEVPKPVAERHVGEMQFGKPILITGQLSGGGGIVASEIHLGPPRHSEQESESDFE